MKDGLIRIVRAGARTYIRYAPWKHGKRTLYTKIVKPWVLWRDGTATATTNSGVRHRVHLPDEIDSRIYYFGVWEPSVTRVFQNILKRGDTVVDIGANVGYYTLLSSKCVGPIGHVYAIEASPTIYRMLVEGIKENAVDNVTPYLCAVHAERMDIPIYRSDKSTLGMSTIMQPGMAHQFEAKVEARPLGDIVPLDRLLNAKLVKIDVEGAEWLVFQGIRPILDRFSPQAHWLIEMAPERIGADKAQQIFDTFISLGYSAWHVPNDYSDEEYFEPRKGELRRLNAAPAKQSDVLFARDHLAP